MKRNFDLEPSKRNHRKIKKKKKDPRVFKSPHVRENKDFLMMEGEKSSL